MSFHPGTILVFDRSGAAIGQLTGWSVTVPRSYGMNEIDDFSFLLPLVNKDGTDLVTTAMADTLLQEDNLIYVEDEIEGLPGWGGEIDSVNYGDETVEIRVLGGPVLLSALDTGSRLSQTAGVASTMAQRLVDAANAKKAAHGDLQVGLIVEGSSPLYGTFEYEGDVYSGMTTLASDSLSEFWAIWTLGAGAATLSCDIHWARRHIVDHTGIVITDGDGGQLKSGSHFVTQGLEVVNRIRLKGAPTHLADFLDYDCIKSIVKDVSPEVEYEITSLPNMRLREDLSLSVNFGLSDDAQKAIATTGYVDPLSGDLIPGIQDTYIGLYKTFLYAYHNWQGKPFLEGFDWSGPDGQNDKSLISKNFRSWNKMAVNGPHSTITSATDGNLPNAVIDEWAIDTTVDPVSGSAVGIALDWGTLSGHWVANGATGTLVLLDADNVTTAIWGSVASGSETLLSVATDPAVINQVWVLISSGGSYLIRSYDVETNALLLQYTIPSTGTPRDIALDYATGILYVTGTGSSTVYAYDVNSGSPLSPDPSFSAGGTGNNIGISVTGGIAYVLKSSGEVRMIFVADGTLAGTFATGVASADAILADFTNRRIWIVTSTGSIAIYHAYVAIGSTTDGNSIAGAPGFDVLHTGRFLHIVMTSEGTHGPATKPTPGASTTYTVRPGDSLWKIALHFYGAGPLWKSIYRANKAVIGSNPSLIFPGQHFVIPNINHTVPAVTATRYFVTYTVGRWVQTTAPGPIGQPDQIQRVWEMDDQVSGYSHEGGGGSTAVSPAIVIVGEEGRVCDWNPTLDGYGVLKEDQRWRTKTGHIVDTGHGWYPQQWDVPDRAFEPPPRPHWPEGLAYAQDYLNHKNRKFSAQQITITNTGNLWGSIERGGVYTLHATKQGPRPGGIDIEIRILKFSPNDVTGEMECIAEINYDDIAAPVPVP